MAGYRPVTLTGEILLKCGFNSKLELGLEHLSFIYYEQNNLGVKGMLGLVKPYSVKYLHQLQNIIFSLTNQELNTSKL